MRKLIRAGMPIVFSWFLIPSAEAQVSRVFVSVNGNDANVCSNIATPCRTFTGGIGQVDLYGEVIVIDTGSYAGGTITKSVKINVPAGLVAFSGLPFVVNPGSGGTVVLRGLTLKAATVGVGIGIDHQSGNLLVENTVVDGWHQGIRSHTSAELLSVKGSVIRNSTDRGILVNTGLATVDQSFLERNSAAGIHFWGGSGRVTNTVMNYQQYGGAVQDAPSEVVFQRCEATGNSAGLAAFFGGVLRVSASTLTKNAFGLQNTGGTLQSYGNNVLHGNTTAPTTGGVDGISTQ